MTGRDAATEGAWAQSVRIAFGLLTAGVCVLAAAWAGSGVRQVPPDSRAAVLRFGRVVRVEPAGLLLAWPPPVEQVVLLPARDRQVELKVAALDLPVRPRFYGLITDVPIDKDARRNAAFMLTGDLGVVRLRASLFYRVTDPSAFLLVRDRLDAALERVFLAAAIAVCASRDIDAILVARSEDAGTGPGAAEARARLRADLVRAVNDRLAGLAAGDSGLGVRVERVDLVTDLPGVARDAFDRVLTASQATERMVADARTYAERKAQDAAREAATLLSQADAAASERLGEAQARTAGMLAVAGAARQEGGTVLVRRIYAERVGAILRRAEAVQAIDAAAGPRVVLPGATP